MKGQKPTKRKNALGRGLGAILQDSTALEHSENKTDNTEIGKIPLDLIEVNPFQPRTIFNEEALEELSESIRLQGIIQPITVRKIESGKYQLISGERRLQASQQAGMENIPAYIRKANDQQMLEMALIENIQRENLNAIEIALSYQRLISECNLKQEDLGERVGKKRATVNNYLRLLKLPPAIQLGIKENKISMGHARALINVENVEMQLAIFQKIIDEGLSVRKVESLVRGILTENVQKKGEKQNYKPSSEVIQLQGRLSSHFGTKVKINHNKQNKGEIKIPFLSIEDLNRILEILDV
ncbi:ParB/RepB/Spo0J family partition protein [Xanthovirga aplysinae]|uniref:ParB/RepB/Spo0J family partition protein n=1 Tax=Xanthovirga aplysinae TaxID=2529853 RepID=UPI0012BC218E|nr:ParB/RepB/Spo0J family partition protein [Xanthovirga aplysinae]MTI30886.1 ParB/RepB/Spo0J family partition protein [Xanthovirga aplysinae]